jgi:acyl carrier protein
MEKPEVLKQLTYFISFEVLNGSASGLEDTSPLLEWGILNSLEMVRIITFIQNQFNIQVPNEEVTAEHFKDMTSIADLILDLVKIQSTEASQPTVSSK